MMNRQTVRLVKSLKNGLLSKLRRRPMSISNADQDSLEAAMRHRSFDSMAGILNWLLTLTKSEFNDFTLDGRKALEIGTGKFFVHALGLYVVDVMRWFQLTNISNCFRLQ